MAAASRMASGVSEKNRINKMRLYTVTVLYRTMDHRLSISPNPLMTKYSWMMPGSKIIIMMKKAINSFFPGRTGRVMA